MNGYLHFISFSEICEHCEVSYRNHPCQSLGSNELLSRSQRFVFALFFPLFWYSNLELTVVHLILATGGLAWGWMEPSQRASSASYLRFAKWFDTNCSPSRPIKRTSRTRISSLMNKSCFAMVFTSFYYSRKTRTDLNRRTTWCDHYWNLIRKARQLTSQGEVSHFCFSQLYMKYSSFILCQVLLFFNKCNNVCNSTPVVSKMNGISCGFPKGLARWLSLLVPLSDFFFNNSRSPWCPLQHFPYNGVLPRSSTSDQKIFNSARPISTIHDDAPSAITCCRVTSFGLAQVLQPMKHCWSLGYRESGE